MENLNTTWKSHNPISKIMKMCERVFINKALTQNPPAVAMERDLSKSLQRKHEAVAMATYAIPPTFFEN